MNTRWVTTIAFGAFALGLGLLSSCKQRHEAAAVKDNIVTPSPEPTAPSPSQTDTQDRAVNAAVSLLLK